MVRIAFDIGGTKTRVAASKDGKTYSDPIKIKTPVDDFEAGIDALCEAAKEAAGGEEIEAAGGGIAGVFSKDKSRLLRSPNIGAWVDKPLVDSIKERLGCQVFLENDTAVVGLGEAVNGAGTTEGIMAYITVSTGVGGVRIEDGKLDRAAYGFEIGHQFIDFDRSHCGDCPDPGDLESYISGKSLEKRFGKKAYEIEDPVVWEHEAKLLAVGLANTIVHWSPDVVVLGGSMIVGTPSISVDHVRKHLADFLTIYPELPDIREAGCGDVGGLQGALELIRQRMDS